MLNVYIRRVIDPERRVAGIMHVNIRNGDLAVLADDNASTASVDLQRAKANVSAAMYDGDVGERACAPVNGEPLDLHALGGPNIQRGIEEASATCTGLYESGSGLASQHQIVKTANLNEFGAGSIDRHGVGRLAVQLGEGLIQGLAFAAVHRDRRGSWLPSRGDTCQHEEQNRNCRE